MKRHVILAILRRELISYFSSPTGYVFITIFIFLSAFAAFWLPGFFDRNLANLDQLNAWFPGLLLFIVPAITMGAWAEERKQGTEELLLTLPARDWELVLGKYLACLAVYTACLVFSFSHVLVLMYLGKPDVGVLLANYLGHFLAGAGLIAVGMVGSALTANLTVAFIIGALLCGAVVGVGVLERIGGSGLEWLGRTAEVLALPNRFEDFGRGVVSIENVAYFVALAVIGLSVNVFLVGRRHWTGSKDSGVRVGLGGVRLAAFLVAGACLVVLLGRTAVRADVTAERLWSLSAETRELVRGISPDRPVLITAYLSRDVPGTYVQTRETLVGLLRELDQVGGGRVAVKIVETEKYSDAAREAERNFGIKPRTLMPAPDDADQRQRDVFLGVAFACGAEETVIPFMSKGLPIEYELARSIRAVSQTERKKVGILETDANLFGAFDFQSFSSRPDWPIVGELRKQYEVVQVPRTPGDSGPNDESGEQIPADIDVLIVAQPSTLVDDELARVLDYVRSGRPALILEDPLPLMNPNIATSEERDAGRNPFDRSPADTRPKANLAPLFDLLGMDANAQRVVWDAYNPRPQLADLPREFVFVSRHSGAGTINDNDPITSGLQEVAVLAGGELRPREGAKPKVTPLLRTSGLSGYTNYSEMLERNFFGVGGLNPRRRQMQVSGGGLVLAVRVTGGGSSAAGAADAGAGPVPGEAPLNVVFVADLDMISPMFFSLREEGFRDMEFDNVTFVLNAVDVLAGDASLLELRKRRPMHRTLTRLDETRIREQQESLAAVEAANARAEEELAKARDRMQARITEIEQRSDLDETTRRIMIQSVRNTEQQRFDAQTAAIEDAKQSEINEAGARARRDIESVQMRIRLAAVILPPIPAFLLGCAVFANRRAKEKLGVAKERLEAGR